MTIAHCPECREQVSIPLGASRQARVRCPLCSEEYLLDDALRPLPPLLVVVHDPEARTSPVLDETPSVVPVFAGLKQEEVPSFVSDDVSEGFSFEPSAPAAAAPFNFEPESAVPVTRGSNVATRPRARRQQGGTLRMMVQTIGGGVMGLIIAQLILWWMPGNWAKGNRDPFGMATKIEQYVPFVVPTGLRRTTLTAQNDRNAAALGSAKSGASTPTGPRPKAGTKTSTGLDPELPDFTFDANPPSQNTKPGVDRNNKTNATKESAANSEEFPLAGLNDPNTPDKSTSPESDASAPPGINLDPINPTAKTTNGKQKAQPPVDPAGVSTSVTEEKSTKDKPVGVVNASPVSAAAITARLTDVASAERAWDTAENPTNLTKLELITDIYVKLARLGDTVARAGESQVEATELLQPVVEKLSVLAVQPDKLVPLGKLAGRRLKDDRDKGGLVVGIVLSHQSRGKMFETQLRLLATSDPVVTVVSSADLGEQLPANTTVLMLGRWISNPADNLAGYEGVAESVLLHGVHVIVPTSNPQP